MDSDWQAHRLVYLVMRLFKVAAFAAASTILLRCAHMEAPPGGPADTKRPFVAGVWPAPDSTQVSRVVNFKIAFSEWVHTDVERGRVYLNPPLNRKLKTKLSGNILEITSNAKLDTGTTYTLGLLGTVKDLNGLPLESPFELTFSTGVKLDSGRLSGRVLPFQGKPTAASFAALYPRGLELRSTFQTLTHKGSDSIKPNEQPNPTSEKPAYIAPADSLGRFIFKSVRPGRYALLGFQDITANLNPEIGTEAIAPGPTVEITSKEEVKTLSLIAYDTVPLKLMDVKWKNGWERGNLSDGTLHLKFNHPLNPTQSLSSSVFAIHKSGDQKLAPLQLLEFCLHPVTGEVEIRPEPLARDSQFVIVVTGVKDVHGNALDTSRAKAVFVVSSAKDTTKLETIFFGPRKINGEQEKIGPENLIPSRGFAVYYPYLLSDSTFANLKARLQVKADTSAIAFQLIRVNHHEFAIQLPGLKLLGQRLSIGLQALEKPKTLLQNAISDSIPSPNKGTQTVKDTSRTPTIPMGAFSLADSAKLGSLQFKQSASAYGSRIVLRSLFSPQEFSQATPHSEEFKVDSLPQGFYAVDYFRDANGDGLWNTGSLKPWNVQEPYVQLLDSVEVVAGKKGNGNRGGKVKTSDQSAQPVSGSLKSDIQNIQADRILAWPPTW